MPALLVTLSNLRLRSIRICEQGLIMSVWFEGIRDVDCTIEDVQHALEDLGELYAGVVGLMPGLTSVELVEQSPDSVTIETNEGLMKRTNISRRIEPRRAVVEFDEEYEAGLKVTATSHFSEEFTPSATGVTYRLTMTNVEASGFLGFFYRSLGSTKTGNAFLTAYQTYLGNRSD